MSIKKLFTIINGECESEDGLLEAYTGLVEAPKSRIILLEKFSANGETPLFRVVVRYGLVNENGNNLEDEERTLPSWMHPEKIYLMTHPSYKVSF
ncbi:hypothetical protein [Nostoc sp. NMS8]|uniref:hypothetical protein n=1 Tax=Nostoc sp. NMS8 TaxID=2815392 RepID=UPI0025F9FFAF|nr:hypothetical protein [Nostoc sp. NMS8]MBN3957457.1 hypothetical protein [Nostoc sp. NMS8]